MSAKTIAYYRVSTQKQGQSGLGLKAQEEAVARHLGPDAEIVASYVETESGKRDDRPQLRAALDHCRRAGATLVVAKLDRLARSARFLLEILDSGVEVDFADMPAISGPQGRFMLASMANVAELEAGLISQRTRAALAAARARGTRLGGPRGTENLRRHRDAACKASAESRVRAANERAEAWRSTIESMIAAGMGNKAISDELNERGEPGVSGGRWTATAVRRIRERLGLVDVTACRQAAA